MPDLERVIYLDHHAASPVDPRVRAAIDEARERAWANPSSVHAAGRAARATLERAREQIAAAVGARPADVVLTAGGTEACNLGVLGLPSARGRTVTTEIEHPAVAEACALRDGVTVALRAPGGVAPSEDAFAAAIEGADLAAVQWVNHETGTILPVERYAALCRRAGVALFVDATQALGKLPVDVRALGATAVAFASSKIGGPPAVGALVVDREAALAPRIIGGAQERGRRAGSPDPAAAAGFGAAAALVDERRAAMAAIARRRDRLEAALVEHGPPETSGAASSAPGPEIVANGAGGPRVATVTNLSVRGWRGTALVAALDLEGLCCSSGAACSSGIDAPSQSIAAMHADEPWRAEAALRLSLGPSTSDDDVDGALVILRRVLARKHD